MQMERLTLITMSGNTIIDSTIAESAIIYSDVRLERSAIGEKTIIYRGAWIRDSVLKNSCFASDESKLDNCRLENYSRAGRFNHLYHVDLGRHTYTGQNTVIMNCMIGSFTSISWNVTIGAGEHNYKFLSTHTFLYNPYDELYDGEPAYNRFSEPIQIGNDVWIGAGACVLRGVNVGHGAVIGANAVVTKDVPPYAIVVGNPGRILKYRFAPESIKKLLKAEWWNLSDEEIRDRFYLFKQGAQSDEHIDEYLNQLLGDHHS